MTAGAEANGPRDERRLRYPSRPNALETFYPVLKDWADEWGLPPDERHRWLVAITEIFTNAIIHGHQGDDNKEVEVTLRSWPDRLEAIIVDSGEGLPENPRETPPGDADATGGRGLHLAHELSDDLEMLGTPGGGLTVRLTWKLSTLPRAGASLTHVDK